MTDTPAITPAACAQLAEKAIGEYIQATGAFGNPELAVKALEMLISKAALGLNVVAPPETMMAVMLRSAYNAAAKAGRDVGLSDGFDAGFYESGEGYNGEYPCGIMDEPDYAVNTAEALSRHKSKPAL